jgi:hypothetical protein
MHKLITLVVAFIAFTLVVEGAGAVQSTPDKVIGNVRIEASERFVSVLHAL